LGRLAPLICSHERFHHLSSLTSWITVNVLVLGLCFAARLGDLQLAAVYVPLSPYTSSFGILAD
jgi:hypothetical protein